MTTTRAAARAARARARRELERARAEVERVKQFLAGEPQIVVVWDRADTEPRVEGEFSLVSDAMNPRRILAFSGWLDPETAARAEGMVASCWRAAKAFRTTASLSGRHLELAGRAIGGNAVMRIRDISGDRLECCASARPTPPPWPPTIA